MWCFIFFASFALAQDAHVPTLKKRLQSFYRFHPGGFRATAPPRVDRDHFYHFKILPDVPMQTLEAPPFGMNILGEKGELLRAKFAVMLPNRKIYLQIAVPMRDPLTLSQIETIKKVDSLSFLERRNADRKTARALRLRQGKWRFLDPVTYRYLEIGERLANGTVLFSGVKRIEFLRERRRPADPGSIRLAWLVPQRGTEAWKTAEELWQSLPSSQRRRLAVARFSDMEEGRGSYYLKSGSTWVKKQRPGHGYYIEDYLRGDFTQSVRFKLVLLSESKQQSSTLYTVFFLIKGPDDLKHDEKEALFLSFVAESPFSRLGPMPYLTDDK